MSTTPMKGKADYLALGDWNVACAECGRKFKASEMRQLPPGVPGGGMWVCLPHWNQRQPQDYVRGRPDKMAAPFVQQQVDTFVEGGYLITEASSEEDPNYIMTENFYPITTEN